jgi:hypothetical protein
MLKLLHQSMKFTHFYYIGLVQGNKFFVPIVLQKMYLDKFMTISKISRK